MLNTTTGVALNALSALQKIAQANFPAKEAFLIAKMLAKLRNHADVQATDTVRIALAKKYGEEDGKGQTLVRARLAEFLAEYGPIAAQPIEIDTPLLPLSILDHAPEMTPDDMLALEPLWAAPEENQEK